MEAIGDKIWALDASNARIIDLTVNYNFRSSDIIKVTYIGTRIKALDGSTLASFNNRIVKNTIYFVYDVPGKIEAEGYFFQESIQLEVTSDNGGGQNIGYLDIGDYLDYSIEVAESGTYQVDYRTAALSEMGQIQLLLVEGDSTTLLHTVTFPVTGGWQTWTTTSAEAVLKKGRHQLRILITQPLFNINWFEFSFLTSSADESVIKEVKLYPNPGNGIFYFQGILEIQGNLLIRVYNLQGQPIYTKELKNSLEITEVLDLGNVVDGLYMVTVIGKNGKVFSKPILKVSK